MLKSQVGPFPEPEFPRDVDLGAEERKARLRLYPVTIIYSVYFVVILGLALRSRPLPALGFLVSGIAVWSAVEYLVHRFVLHGVFPDGDRLLTHWLHELFDSMHADHHARPWDGMYINGHLDTLFVAAVIVPLSFLTPRYTAPVFIAALLQCFVIEEWVHHSVHFFNFKSSYFQYLRRRHYYHHSRRGTGIVYGVTSGVWDTLVGTRVPFADRELLSVWPKRKPSSNELEPVGAADQPGADDA